MRGPVSEKPKHLLAIFANWLLVEVSDLAQVHKNNFLNCSKLNSHAATILIIL